MADDTPIPVDLSVVVNTQLITQADLNQHGTCSGAAILCWIDIAAGLAAKRLTNSSVVTASVDAVHFLGPSYKGELLIISAMVNRCFKTSMEVGVRVEAENLETGVRRYCCSAYLTFVATNDAGKPQPVKQVKANTKDEKRRFNSAKERRVTRLNAKNVKDPLVDAIAVYQRTAPSCDAGNLKASHTQMVYQIFPQHANSTGNTFGGQIMSWMETAGQIAASRFNRNPRAVLVSMDNLSFKEATKIGDIVYIVAKVSASYTTSVETVVSVYKGRGLELIHCNSAFMTFANIEAENGKSIAVPKANATTAEEMALVSTAWHRRKIRMDHLQKLKRPENMNSD